MYDSARQVSKFYDELHITSIKKCGNSSFRCKCRNEIGQAFQRTYTEKLCKLTCSLFYLCQTINQRSISEPITRKKPRYLEKIFEFYLDFYPYNQLFRERAALPREQKMCQQKENLGL